MYKEQCYRKQPAVACVMQGRLIPGTSLASLPFIDALRTRTPGREPLPEECFKRLRGALFLGPSWTVTRNKLKMR